MHELDGSLHLYNIQGCLEKYRDIKTVSAWLRKAASELTRDQLMSLVESINGWLISHYDYFDLAEELFQLLEKFDPSGDSQRRRQFADTQQRIISERMVLEEQERAAQIRAREQMEAKAELERVALKKREDEDREHRRQEDARRQREASRLSYLLEIRNRLRHDYLGTEHYYREVCSSFVSKREFDFEKIQFIKNWSSDLNTERRELPDDDQCKSIAAVHGHVQVVARAGSGKTSTLVNRAFFLQKHCGVKPSEMMLLAFNKKAAEEMETRLGKLLDGQPPFVMTFHALAHALVHPEQNLIHDSPDGRNLALSRFVQEIINDRLRDPEFVGRIRQVMVDHFKEDWDRVEDGGFNLTKEEMLAYRRSLQRETLRGEFVKSFGEKTIANFLFEHQVPYLYEPSERGPLKNYHPDFILKLAGGGGVAIEYFGMAGDPDYDAMSEEKRRYWKSRERVGWKLIECGPDDIRDYGVDDFLNMLKTELETEGLEFRRMSEDEIWQQVSKRAIDRFTMATRSFIARCRKLELTPATLQQHIARHKTRWQVEADFLDIMVPLYRDYLERLDADDKEDFDGLMHRAANSVRAGATIFSRHMKKQHGDLAKLRFMLVDEYQDFSKLFHSLVEAIRQKNPGLQLFCVGDDWQAINGFAGSDLDYYENFTSHFPGAERLHISTNYRSRAAIVAAGNAVMTGHPNPAVAHSTEPGNVLLADISDFTASPNEDVRHGNDLVTPMVLRLAAHALCQAKNIILLSRTNVPPTWINYNAYQGDEGNLPATGIERFRNLIRSYFPEDQRNKIKASTTHGFKGLQGDIVVVLDAVTGCYPLIHQDWIFLRLLGESVETITSESRRLFYVALTRAIDTLVIFTERGRKSPFLEDVERQIHLASIDWRRYPAVSASSDRLKVYVGNQANHGSSPTVAIKRFLAQEQYSYGRLNGTWPSWMKTFPLDGFSVDALMNSTWSPNANGVEVRILDEQDNLVGNYLIDDGVWIESMAFALPGK